MTTSTEYQESFDKAVGLLLSIHKKRALILQQKLDIEGVFKSLLQHKWLTSQGIDWSLGWYQIIGSSWSQCE